ncbi:hypothetical protein B7463_g3075, partial [Scytalidium lignicola]
METTIPLPFLPSVEVGGGETKSEGITRQQLSYLGCLYFTANNANVDEVLGFLQGHISLEVYVNVAAIESLEDIISILDAGAHKVYAKIGQLESLKTYGDRAIPIILEGDEAATPNNYSYGALLETRGGISTYKAAIEKLKEEKVSPIFVLPSEDTDLQAFVKTATELLAIPVVSSTKLSIGEASTGQASVTALIASSWTSDRPDKLIPTIVTDEQGIALGLVYSSQESVAESLKTGTGVYQSRKRGLWYKGATSGDTQELVRISLDCDQDCLKFVVRQNGRGFCHLPQSTCFGDLRGISKLEKTLLSRKISAPEGSYTARLFSDEKLLRAKIMEEAEELCNAKTKQEIAFEAADLIYFALTKCISAGVSVADIERNLDSKSVKVKRRQGDAKGQWAVKEGIFPAAESGSTKIEGVKKAGGNSVDKQNGRIQMKRYNAATTSEVELKEILQRPSQRSSDTIMGIVKPIIDDVRTGGDNALLRYTHKFEKATSLTSPVIKAPFPQELMNLSPETMKAIDVSFDNIRKFHAAQREDKPLKVETMPGVVCSRFSRPIERVGLYVPGGTAVLPSTALMLGVPAMVAGCKKIVLASPPRADGSVTPEIVYVAHKVGAESIVLAGGAQAVSAMAYGTESVSKVDKILGPGNQFVTAAKMYVSNDTNAGVSIDMPAGPSEVLVVADKYANPAFVASDLLSQAEHGVDSQVILIAVDLSEKELQAIEDELHAQAMALPRVDIVKGAIDHSITLLVKDVEEAMRLSNEYAPEHLILQLKGAAAVVSLVENAGSVFIGEWTPESVGDYSAGVNHSLPTYGFAKQYSGVNLGSYVKHITSSMLTAGGLKNVGEAVMQLAKVEELEAHRRAFNLLPPELRLKIWSFSLPNPRIVPIFAVTIGSYPISVLPNPTPAGFIRMPPALACVDRVFTSHHRLPGVLSACRESRHVMLKWYKYRLNADEHCGGNDLYRHGKSGRLDTNIWASGRGHILAIRKGKPQFTLLDAAHDLLFLQDPPQHFTALGSVRSSSLLVLVRWIGIDITENLRLLAIPYCTWRRDRERGRLQLLMKFIALDYLYVSFLSTTPEPQSPGWESVMSQAVNEEIESHMREMQREVVDDLDKLAMSKPFWKRPKLRFVKDVDVLSKEFGLGL